MTNGEYKLIFLRLAEMIEECGTTAGYNGSCNMVVDRDKFRRLLMAEVALNPTRDVESKP